MVHTTLKCSDMDHTDFNLQRTPCLPLPRKCSPDGASYECGGEHLIAAHYSLIDPEKRLSWPRCKTCKNRSTIPELEFNMKWNVFCDPLCTSAVSYRLIYHAESCGYYVNYIVSQKNTCHLFFDNNYRVSAYVETEMNTLQRRYKTFNFTLTMSPHYLVN